MSLEHEDKIVEKNVFQAEAQDVYDEPAIDPIYQAKARILNDALQDIGMGKYQASPFFPFPCTYSTIISLVFWVWGD